MFVFKMLDLLSYLLAVIVRLVITALSIPIGILGKIYDLLFKKLPNEPHTILITGANSGICKEIALLYAKPVIVVLFLISQGNTLFLIARNKERLNQVAQLAREKGATVNVASIDATDDKKMREYIQEQDKKYTVHN